MKFPNLRKKEDWNHVQISFKGPRLQVTLNGTKICDVTDNPMDPAEAACLVIEREMSRSCHR